MTLTVAAAAGASGALFLACGALLCYRCLHRKGSQRPLLRSAPRHARSGASSLAYTQGMLHVVCAGPTGPNSRGGASAAQPRTGHGHSQLAQPCRQPYGQEPPPQQNVAAAPALARLAAPTSTPSTVAGPTPRGFIDALTERFSPSRESLTDRFSVLSQTTERFSDVSDVELSPADAEFAPADMDTDLRRTHSLMSHNI